MVRVSLLIFSILFFSCDNTEKTTSKEDKKRSQQSLKAQIPKIEIRHAKKI